jgi:hypothetical protein
MDGKAKSEIYLSTKDENIEHSLSLSLAWSQILYLSCLIAMILYDVKRFGFQQQMQQVMQKPIVYFEILAEIFLGNVVVSDMM